MKHKHRTNSFTRSEFRAIVLSLVIITVGVALPPYMTGVTSNTEMPTVLVRIHNEQSDQRDTLPVKPVKDTQESTITLRKSGERTPSYSAKRRIIDINSADSIELKSLRGIGNVLSKRIIKFRDKLGGFHSVEQVAETYGLSPETFEAIRSDLTIATPHIRLSVSTSSVETLAAHPYISWEQARRLSRIPGRDTIAIRRDHLLSAGDSIWVDNILPYLDITP